LWLELFTRALEVFTAFTYIIEEPIGRLQSGNLKLEREQYMQFFAGITMQGKHFKQTLHSNGALEGVRFGVPIDFC